MKEEEAVEETKGFIFIDAKNGFNELSRLAIIWMVSHRCPPSAIFALN